MPLTACLKQLEPDDRYIAGDGDQRALMIPESYSYISRNICFSKTNGDRVQWYIVLKDDESKYPNASAANFHVEDESKFGLGGVIL
jgi:hypothetical protein